jgi:outer membrane protein OmpA-like peptidoglycan-associated protein
MRKPALLILLSSIAAVAAPAAAQRAQPSTPAPTVDDYVCTFSGNCGQDASDTPDPNAPRPRITATRGFALSGTNTGGSAATHRAGPPALHRRAARNLAASSTNRVSSSAAAATPAAGPGQRLNLQLTFVSGSAQLTAAARAQAQIFAQALMQPQLQSMRFEIEGHTDAVGSRDRNLDLSQRRAQTVADFLTHAGVSPERLVVHGYGPDRPLPGVPGTAAVNRRVEVVRIS